MINELNMTNVVNSKNVNYLKVKIMNMVEYSYYIDKFFNNIELMMGMFTYENEQIETEVFSYILSNKK
jgi:hypothetical protein